MSSPTLPTLVQMPSVTGPHAQLLRRAVLRFASLEGPLTLQQGCFRAAIAVILAARDLGIPALFQAGSMQWQAVAPEHDDGVSPTHMAFMWDPTGAASRVLLQRLLHALKADVLPTGRVGLPEVHCWAYLPLTHEIIDLTSGTLPETFRTLTGGEWTAPRPPPHFVGVPEYPTQVYTPIAEATRLTAATALLFLRHTAPHEVQGFIEHLTSSAAQIPRDA